MAQRRLQDRTASRLKARMPRLNLGNRKAACALIATGSAVALFLALAAATRTPAFTVDKSAAVSSSTPAAEETKDAASASTDASSEDKAPSPVLVDIDGAVAHPGVYDIAGTTERVKDAVEAAGGLLDDADTASVNLAQAVTDGMKIHVPKEGEASSSAASAAGTASGSTSAAGSSGTSSTLASSSSDSASSGLVNINTATAEELETLPGVGESTAKAIVQDREEHGAFSSKEDLMRVSGIGEKKYAKLEANICV